MRRSLLIVLLLIAAPASAKNLCVNPTTGNDSNTYSANNAGANTDGTGTSCWATVARAAWGSTVQGSPNSGQAAQAGDVVYVAAGVYTAPGTGVRFLGAFNPANSGDSGSPIRFQCATAGACELRLSSSEGPVMGCRSRDYVIWDGFYVDGTISSSTSDTGHVDFFAATGCQLLNSTIRGRLNRTENDNYNAVRIEDSTGIVIAGNELYDIAVNGVYGGNQAGVMTYDADDALIEHNDIHDVGVGIYFKGTHDESGYTQADNIARLNRIYDVRVGGIEAGSMQSGLIYQNTVSCTSSSAWGIRIQSWPTGTHVPASPRNVDIYNNGINNCGDGFPYDSNDHSSSHWVNLRIWNNIVLNGAYGVHSMGPTNIGSTDHQHNVYHGMSTAVANFGSNLNCAGWIAAGQDDVAPTCSTSDPLITSETVEAEDWHLQGGSFALTHGRTFGGSTIPAGPYITGSEAIGKAQVPSPVIPTERLAVANWQSAGMIAEGGIPARATVCATLSSPGASDASSAIQDAIDACPEGQTVYLNAGTYNVESTLVIDKAITLRGAGAGQTVLEKTNGAYKPIGDWPQSQPTPADESSIIRVGHASSPHFLNTGTKTLTADAVQGATSVTLDNVTGLSVGQFVEVAEDQFFTGSWRALADVQGGPNRWEVWSGDRVAFARYRLVNNPSGTVTSSNAANDRVTISSTTDLQVNDLLYITGHNGTFTPSSSTGRYMVASVPSSGQVTLLVYETNAAVDITSGGTGGTYETGRPWTTFTAGPITGTDSPLEWFNRGNGYLYGEVKEIASIVGSTVTFTSPFTDTYRVSHDAQLAVNDTAFVVGGGVEDLTLWRGARGAVEFLAAAKSWVKNVEIVEWVGHGVQISQSHRIEVTGSYVHGAAWPVPGGGGYALAIEDNSSEVLLTNSVTRDANKNMVANSGGAGSVVSYNYFDDAFIWYDLGWQEVAANASHFAGPHHVLFEGNLAPNFDSDFTHGSSYSHTVLRNHLTGTRASFTDSTNVRTLGLGIAQLNMSAVGNVLGVEGAMSGWVLTDPGDFWTSKFVYKIGYDAGDPWWAGDPPTVASFIDGGNWNWLDSEIRTPAAAAVPDSYYLSSTPAFFGACTWPWVDAAGGTKTHTLPAKQRFDAGVAASGAACGDLPPTESGTPVPRRLRFRRGAW